MRGNLIFLISLILASLGAPWRGLPSPGTGLAEGGLVARLVPPPLGRFAARPAPAGGSFFQFSKKNGRPVADRTRDLPRGDTLSLPTGYAIFSSRAARSSASRTRPRAAAAATPTSRAPARRGCAARGAAATRRARRRSPRGATAPTCRAGRSSRPWSCPRLRRRRPLRRRGSSAHFCSGVCHTLSCDHLHRISAVHHHQRIGTSTQTIDTALSSHRSSRRPPCAQPMHTDRTCMRSRSALRLRSCHASLP